MLRRQARCHRGVGGGLPKCKEGGHVLQPDGAPLLTHLQPLPPWPARASQGPPSWWPPSTFQTPRRHLPAPPPPLRTSGDQPPSPEARPGSGPLPSLPAAPWGTVAGAPTEAPLSPPNPSDRDRLKQKLIRDDKWRRAGRRLGRRGGGGGFVRHYFVTARLLRGRESE